MRFVQGHFSLLQIQQALGQAALGDQGRMHGHDHGIGFASDQIRAFRKTRSQRLWDGRVNESFESGKKTIHFLIRFRKIQIRDNIRELHSQIRLDKRNVKLVEFCPYHLHRMINFQIIHVRLLRQHGFQMADFLIQRSELVPLAVIFPVLCLLQTMHNLKNKPPRPDFQNGVIHPGKGP